MIFRQLFDSVSSTYSCVLASRCGGEPFIIDPLLEKVDRYLTLMEELDLRLVKAVDTHLHEALPGNRQFAAGVGALLPPKTALFQHRLPAPLSSSASIGASADHEPRHIAIPAPAGETAARLTIDPLRAMLA